MLSFEDRQIKEYSRRLREINQKGIPLAVAATLDNLAFTSRQIAIKKFEREYTIRSTWTQRGMLYQKTLKTDPIKKMESRVGNIREYAALLEAGGHVEPKSGSLVEIPALGARIAKSKQRRIAKRYSLRQLQRLRRMPNIKGTAKRKFAAMLNIARKEKYYGPFLVTHQEAGNERITRGIFMLAGAGRGRRGGGKIVMIRKLQRGAQVPGRPYIYPSAAMVGAKMDRFYIQNARQMLRRYAGDIR